MYANNKDKKIKSIFFSQKLANYLDFPQLSFKLKIQVCVKLSGIGVASCSNFHFHKHLHLHCLKCTKMNPFQIFYTYKQRSDKEEVNKYDSILELLKKNKCA